MDDGSTDGMLESLPKDGWLHLRNEKNHGIGSAMKRVFQYALDNNYDVLVIQAGNDKDDPNEIPRLLEPIASGRADFVQGSRFFPAEATAIRRFTACWPRVSSIPCCSLCLWVSMSPKPPTAFAPFAPRFCGTSVSIGGRSGWINMN